MKENFQPAVDYIISPAVEGGYVNNAHDPGAATNWGITQAEYSIYLGRSATPEDVKNMPQSVAIEIYRARYWNYVHGDDLPAGVDFAMFDCAINQGQPTAIKLLQQTLRITSDGVMGPQTISLAGKANAKELLVGFMARRAVRYAHNPNIGTFGEGWYEREFHVHQYALALILNQGKLNPNKGV